MTWQLRVPAHFTWCSTYHCRPSRQAIHLLISLPFCHSMEYLFSVGLSWTTVQQDRHSIQPLFHSTLPPLLINDIKQLYDTWHTDSCTTNRLPFRFIRLPCGRDCPGVTRPISQTSHPLPLHAHLPQPGSVLHGRHRAHPPPLTYLHNALTRITPLSISGLDMLL